MKLTWLGIGLLLVLAGVILAMQPENTPARSLAQGIIRIGYALEAPITVIDDQVETCGEAPGIPGPVVSKIGMPRIEWRQIGIDQLIRTLDGRCNEIRLADAIMSPLLSMSTSLLHS